MSRVEPGSSEAASISIDQLIALNDEIAALVRSGFPIERGLVNAEADLPGRLGSITGILAARMSRGESLTQALESESKAIPPLYRAVVEAGARAGRLPAALEGLAVLTRGYAEARRAIGLALVYPLMIASLAYALVLGFLWIVLPRFVAALEALDVTVASPVRWLESVGQTVVYWWPVGPLILLLFVVTWYRSGRTTSFSLSGWSPLRALPWTRRMLADFEAANFADLMALLLDHGVPLDEALKLSGDASGDPRLSRETSEIGETLRLGVPAREALASKGRLMTPLLRWVLAESSSRIIMGETLRNLASNYRKRAVHRAEALQILFPIVLLLGVGALASLVYGLVLVVPLLNLLNGLSLQ